MYLEVNSMVRTLLEALPQCDCRFCAAFLHEVTIIKSNSIAATICSQSNVYILIIIITHL